MTSEQAKQALDSLTPAERARLEAFARERDSEFHTAHSIGAAVGASYADYTEIVLDPIREELSRIIAERQPVEVDLSDIELRYVPGASQWSFSLFYPTVEERDAAERWHYAHAYLREIARRLNGDGWKPEFRERVYVFSFHLGSEVWEVNEWMFHVNYHGTQVFRTREIAERALQAMADAGLLDDLRLPPGATP